MELNEKKIIKFKKKRKKGKIIGMIESNEIPRNLLRANRCSRKMNNVGSWRERLVKNPLNILEEFLTSGELSWEFCTADRHSRRRLEGQRGTNGPRISESPTPPSRPIIVEWTDTYLSSRRKSPRWRASHRTRRISATAIWN